MPLFSTLLITAGIVFAFVTTLFVVSTIIKRNDLADIAWGPGIALATLTAWWSNGFSDNPVTLVVMILTLIWATRIGVRILLKNLGKPEDARYKRWRDSWGKWFYLRSYLQVFLLQGALMIVLAMSGVVASINTTSTVPTIAIGIGATLWLIGFFFETVADYQLDRFLKNPDNKGKLMRYGLWKYSRHPNYFGEVTMWWGIWFMIASLPLGLAALVSPITITILILYVSGIPLLEESMSKHEDWADYKRTTSVFIPWPSKSQII